MPVFRQPTLWAKPLRTLVTRGGRTRIQGGGLRKTVRRHTLAGDPWYVKLDSMFRKGRVR